MGTSFVREWCAAAAGLLRELGYLLFPRGCAGCDAPDEVLCSRCESKFHHCIPFRLHPGCLLYTSVSHVPDLHGAVPRMLVNRTADVHDTLAVVGM